MKILIGSPVRQKANILSYFLKGLDLLDKEGIEVAYYFVDDNTDAESSKLLNDFSNKNANVLVRKANDFGFFVDKNYSCNNITHIWKSDLIAKITKFKNDIIQYGLDNKFDYLFFIDSDIVLCKNTLKHLLSRNVEIISNVFWSQWFIGGPIEPQVWMQDVGNTYITDWDNPLSKAEIKQSKKDFAAKMRIPGLYEVGGLGACTLIKRTALEKGVNFSLVKNISFWGEDRHFCVRASARDIKMYVDTVYPVYHIYREQYLDRVEEFIEDGFKFDMCQTFKGIPFKDKITLKLSTFKRRLKKVLRILKDSVKEKRANKFKSKRNKYINDLNNKTIVLSMVVHNESGRYLEMVLKDAIKYVDKVVIVDDASTDNTVEICESILKDVPHKIIKNKKSLFSKEYKLRKLQWNETLKENPGWVLSLDADEMFEEKMKTEIRYLILDDSVDMYRFRLYDMWDNENYRDDELWQAHRHYGTFLIRVLPKYAYKFRKTNQHCGRLPKNLNNMSFINSDIRLKHYGWAREEDRKRKYDRYLSLDPNGKFGNMEQYKSIMDKHPHLIKFEDGNENNR